MGATEMIYRKSWIYRAAVDYVLKTAMETRGSIVVLRTRRIAYYIGLRHPTLRQRQVIALALRDLATILPMHKEKRGKNTVYILDAKQAKKTLKHNLYKAPMYNSTR